MTRDRDIAAFDARAGSYDGGWLGRLHQQIADRTAQLALAVAPAPRRILDVGCGTGYLLRELAGRCPQAVELVGVDPARGMLAAARTAAGDVRLRWVEGTAEELPFPAGLFDLAVSTTSFDHWADQQAGLAECARVLAPGGWLVLTDLFSGWLAPTLVGGRRHKARTKRRASRLLAAAGFRPRSGTTLRPLLFAPSRPRAGNADGRTAAGHDRCPFYSRPRRSRGPIIVFSTPIRG